ncbi:astacin [Oesophagostomum dentatum]|uniref:Metalloendopeptidase n=1 Tax=Oesophagostomum dentatum TaxID=61180 RepID=A0A0B1TGI6_OESDE|nr:astacin [Oesophagostomum dentatum]
MKVDPSPVRSGPRSDATVVSKFEILHVLRELVDPLEQISLRDTLSKVVENEFEGQEIGSDFDGVIPTYTKMTPTINELNRNYSRAWKTLCSGGNTVLEKEDMHSLQTENKRTGASGSEVYLLFVGYDYGCWSTVGRDAYQRQQIVSIGRGCEAFGITSHEVAHALGLFHEQSRYDRNNWITVYPKRIPPSQLYNFARESFTDVVPIQCAYEKCMRTSWLRCTPASR